MYSLKNKIVLVTGASSGIGESTARAFAGLGSRLILSARRAERLQSLSKELQNTCGVATHIIQLDVRDQKAVAKAIADLPSEWSSIEILVNNAGLSRSMDKVQDGNIEDWDEMVDTNVKGLLYVSRAVLPGMIERGSGHVINIGSIAGQEIYPGGNVYCATKHAVKALSKAMRVDLLGTPLRVTCVDPGMAQTEFSIVRFHGDEEHADKVYEGFKPLAPEDVADAIVYCATRPAHVNIDDLTIMPQAQASTMLVNRLS